MSNLKIGFIGLGTMGFPMCYNLFKSGYQMILPTYRRNIDINGGYSPLAPNLETKNQMINEMLESGAYESSSLQNQIANSNVIMVSMPSSVQVEELILSPDGILSNAHEGTVVIDLTTSNPNSTKRLAKLLEEKRIDFIDAPISGGSIGAINKSLSIMVGGKLSIFNKYSDILYNIGEKSKVIHVGEVGSGHTLKLVNNFLSAVGTIATTEALMVSTKAGISPQVAIDILKDSGGRNDATMNKFPNYILVDKPFNFTIDLMCKDLRLYNEVAKELRIPSFIANDVYQICSIPQAMGEGEEDLLNVIKMFEKWCGVELIGTANNLNGI